MSIVTIVLTMIVANLLIPYMHAAVGEKKQKLTSRSEMAPMGDYLYVAETAYLSNTPAFFAVKTTNELECKCTCSSHKQCLSMTYRRSDGYCSLYANDPCDTRMWQSNANMHFYIHVKRLKYRLYDPPKQNEPLKRLSISSLCGDMTGFDADQRWLFVMKLSGRSQVSFNASNFDQAPNQVAPSPWSTTPIETMWSSTLMQQWYSSVQLSLDLSICREERSSFSPRDARLYFPKYFGLALIFNGVVRQFVHFRLHKTTITNFFNKQHTPLAFCWNLKDSRAHLNHTLDFGGPSKRLFSISLNGNTAHNSPCAEHETFMYISPFGQTDRCASDPQSSQSTQILFSDRCQATSYGQLLRADALIGLTSGDTSTDI